MEFIKMLISVILLIMAGLMTLGMTAELVSSAIMMADLNQIKGKVNGVFGIEVGSESYEVIFGSFLNESWCAIPSHNISCRLGKIDELLYNTKCLRNAGVADKAAEEIAECIKMYKTLARHRYKQEMLNNFPSSKFNRKGQ